MLSIVALNCQSTIKEVGDCLEIYMQIGSKEVDYASIQEKSFRRAYYYHAHYPHESYEHRASG